MGYVDIVVDTITEGAQLDEWLKTTNMPIKSQVSLYCRENQRTYIYRTNEFGAPNLFKQTDSDYKEELGYGL